MAIILFAALSLNTVADYRRSLQSAGHVVMAGTTTEGIKRALCESKTVDLMVVCGLETTFKYDVEEARRAGSTKPIIYLHFGFWSGVHQFRDNLHHLRLVESTPGDLVELVAEVLETAPTAERSAEIK